MTDTNSPKRRGRPPKPRAWVDDPWSATRAQSPYPTRHMRIRAGVIEQAWQHPAGIAWRPLPVVPDDSPEWED